MSRVREVTPKVLQMLKEHPATRSNDRLLIREIYTKCYGVNPFAPFGEVVMRNDLPSFESIRRARQTRETGLHDEDMKRRRVPVIAINDETGESKRFASMLEASKALGISQGNISKATKRGHRAGGYRFRREGA